MLFYHIFQTSAGWIGALASTNGLRGVTLPQETEAQARRALGNDLEKATRAPERFHDLAEQFKAYFTGQKVDFPDKLDIQSATPFQRKVWKTTREIPYGQTRSYRWVAVQIGRSKAARAVGQAMRRNPLPFIVPCHRVRARDGGLGGYSGGMEVKRFLLHLENASGIC